MQSVIILLIKQLIDKEEPEITLDMFKEDRDIEMFNLGYRVAKNRIAKDILDWIKFYDNYGKEVKENGKKIRS